MSRTSEGDCTLLGDTGIGSPMCRAGIRPTDVRIALSDAVFDAEAAKGRRGFRAAWPCFVADRHLCPPCTACQPRTKAEAEAEAAKIERVCDAVARGVCVECEIALVRRGPFHVCPNGHDFSFRANCR